MTKLKASGNGKGVRAVETALQVLELVGAAEAIGVSAIAVRLNLTKGGIFRHLQTLLHAGYILQDQDSAAYRLGPKAYALARNVPEPAGIASISEQPMRKLRDAFGLSVVLGLPTFRSVMVLQTISSTKPIEIGVRAGSELALHGSAQGKVALAFGHPTLREQLRKRRLEAITPKTIVDQHALDCEIDLVRRQGYAVAPEETLAGINAVAVPIFSRAGVIAASLAIVASIQYLPADPPSEILTSLADVAKQIEILLCNPLS